MFFKKVLHSKIPCLLILMLLVCDNRIYAHGYSYGWQKGDSQTTLDSSLPLPKRYTPMEDPQSHTQRKPHADDVNIDKKLEATRIDTTNIDSIEHDKYDEIGDIDSRIHELEKEVYMLESQVFYKEKEKHNWQVNTRRSGYYIGVGFVIDLPNTTNEQLGIFINGANMAGMLKLGFLRYYNNNLGIKAEGFGIFGQVQGYDEMLQQYGFRFSLLKDIALHSQIYVGFLAGIGVGGHRFDNKTKIGFQGHFGVSISFTKNHRIEIEKIFLTPVDSVNYKTTYLVSYSFVF